MYRTKAIAIITLVTLLNGNGIAAEIRFKNNLDDPYMLLYRTEAKSDFWPPFPLPKQKSVIFNLQSSGKYYLVLQDNAKRNKQIGWINLNAIVAADPKAELLLTEVLLMKTEEYIVREIGYVLSPRVGLFGRVRYESVPVFTEKRVKVLVTVREPVLELRLNGKKKSLDDFLDPIDRPSPRLDLKRD